MFEALKSGIVPLVRDVSASLGEDRTAPLKGDVDEATQEEFGRDVISSFGYDWSRGRQDRAVHPFCINFGGPGEVRITTRFDPGLLHVLSSLRARPRPGSGKPRGAVRTTCGESQPRRRFR
jgi:carboxypeptidase Taq